MKQYFNVNEFDTNGSVVSSISLNNSHISYDIASQLEFTNSNSQSTIYSASENSSNTKNNVKSKADDSTHNDMSVSHKDMAKVL